MSGLTITHRSSVTEDQIDHLGHMNVRFYGVNARTASDACLAALGPTDGIEFEAVDVYTRHHREQFLGARLAVATGVLATGDATARLYHELRNEDSGELAATFVHRYQAVGAEGPAGSWPADRDVETVEIPDHGRPRSVALDSDPIASAPSLATVRERGLAIRLPRDVIAEECDPSGRYRAADAPVLMWGGEPVEGAMGAMLHETEDGAVIGWASMETRMAFRRLPRRGDRIQSFGATVAIHDKTTHQVMWCYRLDDQTGETGELLCTFEVINLAFDTVGRRAVSIPDVLRSQTDGRFHADLRPR